MSKYQLHDVRALLSRCEQEGFEAPDEARDLLLTADDLETPDVVRERRARGLAAAVASGDPDRIAQAREMLDSVSVAHSVDTYRSITAGLAEQIVTAVAEPAFAFVADKYGRVGRRFEDNTRYGVTTLDMAAAMRLVEEPKRDAWLQLEEDAANLDRIGTLLGDLVSRWSDALYAAGGTMTDPHGHHTVRYALGLLFDVGDAHVRRVAEAWTWLDKPPAIRNPQPPTPLDMICRGPGGRWAALLAAGAKIACPCASIATYEPFLLLEQVGGIDPYDSPAAWDACLQYWEDEHAKAVLHDEQRANGGAAVAERAPYEPPLEPARIGAMRRVTAKKVKS